MLDLLSQSTPFLKLNQKVTSKNLVYEGWVICYCLVDLDDVEFLQSLVVILLYRFLDM